MTAGLELKGVSKSYGTAQVLHDISLKVESGELLVLLGPSGSGKSTLLRVISGLIPSDTGEIFINGENVTEVNPARRGVAMVFQSYALFPHLTVYDNLAFGLQSRRVARAEIDAKVAKVATGLRLTKLLARFPREVSGGERQRVALGRAMLREPDVFLMDEPLSNLDTQLRTKMRSEILRLHEELASTMVYVTHDQLEALSMGDRIGILRKGRLEQIGTAQEVYQNPRNLFVARFIGTPMMNTIHLTEANGDRIVWNGNSTATPKKNRGLLATGYDGKLLLGVRAEHICVVGSRWAIGDAPSELLSGTIRRIELAGDQQFVTIEAGEVTLTARVEPDLLLENGGEIKFWFDTEQLHIFDAESGESLSETSK